MSKILYINNNNFHHLGRPQMCAGAWCLFGTWKPHSETQCTVFELEQWFLHQNGPFFHQEFNGKGLWVLGSQFWTKKMKNISEFQNSWNFWIFGSWTQPGAWHMIVPFWSWNLSDTTHVRSHTKFQLIWAINTAFTRGGLNQPPPLTQMCSWDPLTIRVKMKFNVVPIYK